MSETTQEQVLETKDNYLEQYGFHEKENYAFKSQKGINPEIVASISKMRSCPAKGWFPSKVTDSSESWMTR